MKKQDILNDLLLIFENNIDQQGYTSVHGVYHDIKKYMLKLKLEIDKETP